ncbi:MAG TPA: cell division protein SepF [Euzebyales bacterium]
MATMLRNAMVWLGLAEDYEDEYADEIDATASRAIDEPAGDTNVRRLATARTGAAAGTRVRALDDLRAERSQRAHPVSHTTVHYTAPMTFNEVEEVGDRFRNDIPVIMNLAGANESVAKRVLDFASGLIYGLDGRIERVGDRVFLLTPQGVEFSTEERRKLSERGFFNQA